MKEEEKGAPNPTAAAGGNVCGTKRISLSHHHKLPSRLRSSCSVPSRSNRTSDDSYRRHTKTILLRAPKTNKNKTKTNKRSASRAVADVPIVKENGGKKQKTKDDHWSFAAAAADGATTKRQSPFRRSF